MSLELNDIVGNIFYTAKKEKEAEEQKKAQLKQTVNNVFGTSEKPVANTYNPFVKSNGELFNPLLNYQKLLDNPNISQMAKKYISQATGFLPTVTTQNNPKATKQNITESSDYQTYTQNNPINNDFVFNDKEDGNNLLNLDVSTELPKLSTEQIAAIISKHFSKSTVIKPDDAEGIYNAQQNSGMSALAILGIGALESGYGTSSIAKQKNNIWGWGATNDNPAGNAVSFSQMATGAQEFADSFMKTYYNGYGAKTISSAGTGNNPSGKGYAYYNNGTINSNWATSVGSIMNTFYQTAKSTQTSGGNTTPKATGKSGGGSYGYSIGTRIANTSNYNNDAAKGQCVWYVRGRAAEKLGVDTGAIGNANQMYYNAKASAKVPATKENIKPNMIVSYNKGTSTAGQTYGHVIFIEDVVGDTVYYTEGGSGYYKNGTDGVIKTASKQGIIDGVNNNGARMGSEVVGFIDLSKY